MDLYDATEGGPIGLKVGSGDDWDFGFNNDSASDLFISSPALAGYDAVTNGSPRNTLISPNVVENVTSLDEVYDSQALDAGTSAGKITLNNYSSNIVVIMQTADGNYAKVMIKYNTSDNSFIFTEAGEEFIECVVSYQMTPNVPHALTQGSARTGAGQ
jgi:hypothetical protein